MKPSRTSVAQVDLSTALQRGPSPPGNLAVPIFVHGTLAVELYTPKGHDPQTPHERDEIYVIARGSGFFADGTDRRRVEVGTFIFAATGQVHHFEDFSPDFAVWVFFYGPKGGETGGQRKPPGDHASV